MEENKKSCFRLAEVKGLFEDGTAKLQFFGEDEESDKEYSYLQSYIPTVGDTVVLGCVNDSYVILGKIYYKTSPSSAGLSKQDVQDEIEEWSKNSMYVKRLNGIIDEDSIKVTDLRVRGHMIHDGSNIGFFGKTPHTQCRLSTLSSSANTANIIEKVNDIITSLRSYGLFGS